MLMTAVDLLLAGGRQTSQHLYQPAPDRMVLHVTARPTGMSTAGRLLPVVEY